MTQYLPLYYVYGLPGKLQTPWRLMIKADKYELDQAFSELGPESTGSSIESIAIEQMLNGPKLDLIGSFQTQTASNTILNQPYQLSLQKDWIFNASNTPVSYYRCGTLYIFDLESRQVKHYCVYC